MNPVPSQPIPAATVESRRIRSPGSRPSGLPHPRLSLQRRAPRTLRRHLGRAALRLTVLVTADLAAFGLLRELYRLVGEREALGPGIGGAVQRLLPVGYLDGWQFAVALVIGLLVTRNYGAGDARRDPVRLLWGCTLATAMSLWAPLWQRGATVVAVQFLVTTGVAWLGLVAMRFALDYVDAHVVARTPASFRTLLVGPSEACKDLAARPAFAPRGEHAVLGYVDVKLPLTDGALGHVTDLAYLIQKHRVESVVICGHVPEEITRDVVDHAVTAGCHVFAVPPAFEVANVQPSVVWKRGQPVVELTAQTLKAQQFAVKRVMDVVGAVAGIVLLAPVLLLVALVIRLDSPGPVLFRQRRVGIGGRPFEILKFRTMTDGAEALKPALAPLSTSKDPRIFKMPDDPRVSRVGRFLRRWAIDELPQLWNVLRGEMSLVG
ncbi:MAG TPA: sugar transferase, partial [Gemmatimonadales bacterium]|nr:sugar transferase [Gemmatimonadales bacterium]